jgi:hypothetical protein
MLHITDGESVAGTLRQTSIPGEVSIYGDLLYEGPAPNGLTPAEWRETRARFMSAGPHDVAIEQAREYLKACDDALESYRRHDETVLWLDYRLSDQLILIRTLDWFGGQDLSSARLSLICAGQFPGKERFIGLGELTAEELASLAETRVPVTEAQFHLAKEAWSAFTSPDPSALERVLHADSSALPFLAVALGRFLEQFPSVDGGLSRTERQALSILRERGPMPAMRLFVAVQRLEEQIFMGDVSFYGVMTELSAGPHPLIQSAETRVGGATLLMITEVGRSVLEGRADWIELNGIDRWFGGAHLKGREAEWRWDRAARRLIARDQK